MGVLLFLLHIFQGNPKLYAVPDNYLFLQNSQTNQYYKDDVKVNPVFLMYALDMPLKGINQVAYLASMTAVTSLTFDFYNYYDQLALIQKRFTAAGWQAFGDSLKSSGLLEAVLKKKLSSSAVIVGQPVLLNRGYLNGSYSWKYQMIVLLTYESLSEKKTSNHVVTIIFKRVPLIGALAEVGIAVDSFTVSD